MTIGSGASWAEHMPGMGPAAPTMNDIVPVHSPPVPEGWKQTLMGNVLIYTAPKVKGQEEDTILRFTYSRNTHMQDAETFAQTYGTGHKCETTTKLGHGFYTLKCGAESTFTIVIGEVDNLYLIEMKGLADDASKTIVNNYLKELINGKHVFMDRFVGDEE